VRPVRALPYQFSFGDLMPYDEEIDNLILDYKHYQLKRTNAVRRFDTEYVADLDERMRQTRHKLGTIMEAKQNEQYLGEHVRPITRSTTRSPSIQISDEPTVADWKREAGRYVETGSKEHYDKMLTLVRLDHPVPNLARETEPVKTTKKTIGSLTLEDVWIGGRWYLLIFLVWAMFIVLGINLFG
jgi:hypothetical protein